MTDKPKGLTIDQVDKLHAYLERPVMNPQALIAQAIDKGAAVETMERLFTLAKDVRNETAREAWFHAMAEFQRRCPVIKKDSSAKIVTRTGGNYSYNYASLDTILAVVQPLLGELGLSVSWRQKHEAQTVHASCVVAHRLGHHEESGFIAMPYSTDGGRMNPAQAVGSALTYARRYSLLAILGLAPEDDDDAQGTSGKYEGGGGQPRTAQAPRGSAAPGGTMERPEPPHDPDAPELVEESHELFPDPEIDRLVRECQTIIKDQLAKKTIKHADVRQWKFTYLGAEDADPSRCDVAALTDLRAFLASRFPA